MLCKQMRNQQTPRCCGELRGTEKTGFFFFPPKAKLRVKFVVLGVIAFILFFNLHLLWLLWSFVAASFLWLWQGRAVLCGGAQASHCGDFCWGAQAPGTQALVALQ